MSVNTVGCGFQSLLPLLQIVCSDFFTRNAVSRAEGSQYQHSCIILATADNSFKQKTNKLANHHVLDTLLLYIMKQNCMC